MSESVFPASYGQERLWLASQLQPQSSIYNVVVHVALPAGADAALAESALARVVARHEALRTALRAGGDGLSQVVHDAVPVEVTRSDLRGGSPEEVEQRYARACLADAAVPFALDRPPLWRARLVRAGDADWRLTVVCHHTVCDGRSAHILSDEVAELCRAAVEGRPPGLPELAVQYADWAVWQRDRLAPARMAADLAYWRDRLRGAPVVHRVPTDRPRSAVAGDAGAEVRFDVPRDVADRVAGLARRLRVTEFAVLFAAYAAVLARRGGDDLVVGVPVSERDPVEIAPLIGMFVNTVALRVDTSADPRFDELVGQVARTAFDALEHAQAPLQRVVEELRLPRDPALGPLYQIGFNYLADLPLGWAYGTSRDELALELSGREGRLEYRTGLFDAGTAEMIVDRYLRVLDAATRDPRIPVSRLPLLDPGERDHVVALGTGSGESAGAGRCTHELIMGWAARDPTALAVVTPGEELSYGELARRASRLAARLRELGVGPERLAAVAVPRSPDLVVAVLAVLLTGGGYVPLDPAQPPPRLAFMLADSGALVVLASPTGRDVLPQTGIAVLDVADPAGPTPSGAEPPAPTPTPTAVAGPANLAYVVYTSGTTGRPKGSLIEHRSLANYVRWFVDQFGIGAGDRVLASSSPGFDAFGIELFPALVAGGTVVIAPERAGFDPDALLELAAAYGVTMIATVPTVLRLLVDSPALARCTAVRQVVCGGEQLSRELARDLAARLPVPLHNLYGPTETTIDVSFHTVHPTAHPTAHPSSRPFDRPDGPVPIGRPLAGARLYVLDEAGEPTAVGEAGHLHVGGVPVGRGYLGRAALTADRFVPDPIGPPGSRLYRTGDLARWTPDGDLVFLGRRDGQVKIRGIRIEPAEVEAVLREQPGVRDAAVLVREDVPGDWRLVAYLLAGPGAALDHDAVRTALRQSLPAYLVPSAIVTMTVFPVTPHGKVDVGALPPPGPAAGRTRRAPGTPAEELVAGVWADVLGRDAVGADDEFFDLGGHSLLAARIAVRLSDRLGLDVPIPLLFRHLTVAALAQALEDLLVAEIDRLSDEDAERLLAGQGGHR